MPTNADSGAEGTRAVVAVFKTDAEASAAVEALRQAGVAPSDIRRSSGGTGMPAFEPQDQNSGSLMDWILGEESPVRDKSIYSGSAQDFILVVAAKPAHRESLQAILQAHAPVKIEALPAGPA